MRRVAASVPALVLALAPSLAACGDDDAPTDAAATASTAPAGDTQAEGVEDPALRAELLEMLERDQEVRSDMEADWSEVDDANQARIEEIFDEHGWPGWSLVGEDGSTAAWAIVQHADLDVDLQRRGLALLEEAVAAGDASPGDLAYLTDRVRVADGEAQVYGTQWEVTAEGEWVPRTPIDDEAGVDERRAAAGLDPLDVYLAELQSIDG